jgi:hypothetical protein
MSDFEYPKGDIIWLAHHAISVGVLRSNLKLIKKTFAHHMA